MHARLIGARLAARGQHEASWRAARLAVVVGAIAVLAWPITVSRPLSLDGSWQIGLHLAAQQGLRHGVEIVFTYGPLGFLGFPLPELGITSTLALLVALGIYVTLIATMLVQASRILPLWAAALITLAAARTFLLLPPFEASLALSCLWFVLAVADRIPLSPSWFAAVTGVMAGASVLGKLNVGIFIAILGLVTVAIVGRPRWRALVIYAFVAVASGLVLWLAAGQRIADLGAYASGAYQIIAGYNEAMGSDPLPNRTWVYLALAGATAIIVWAGWEASREWPRARRIGLAILGVAFGFAMLKTAVVREHTIYVFATAVVVMFAFPPRIERRTWVVGVLALLIALAGSAALEPGPYVDVVASARAIAREARAAFVPGWPDKAAAQTRRALQHGFGVEPSVLAAIGTHSVHVDPTLAAVTDAYPALNWKPLPVFQTYSAYTPTLDRLDAQALRSPDGPERILRNFQRATPSDRLRAWMGRELRPGEVVPFTVDGRNRWFEAPETTLETFCRYREVVASAKWEVLARSGQSCGAPEVLGTVSARAGKAVDIPVETRPDRFVIAKVKGLEPSLLGRLRALALKGPDWYVRLDDTRYRLVAATAEDGLLLAVPPAADGTGPFAFGTPPRTITVAEGLSGRDSRQPLTYEFLSVPLVQP